jgi:hypothetical protein
MFGSQQLHVRRLGTTTSRVVLLSVMICSHHLLAELSYRALPAALDGVRIVQISDFHWDGPESRSLPPVRRIALTAFAVGWRLMQLASGCCDKGSRRRTKSGRT